jgi:hypothetical protein
VQNGYARLVSDVESPKSPDSERPDEDEVRAFIDERLEHDPKVGWTKLLRTWRESGHACEQKRFRSLYQEAVAERHRQSLPSEDEVWARVREFAEARKKDQQPVPTLSEGIDNYISDVKGARIERISKGRTKASPIMRGEVLRVWRDLVAHGHTNKAQPHYFTLALLQAAMSDLIDNLGDGAIALHGHERMPSDDETAPMGATSSMLTAPVNRGEGQLIENIVRFGRYTLMTPATGGMAESFFAVNYETGEEVFLKRARENTSDYRALQREATIYSKLDRRESEHVLRVLDAEHLEGYFCLVTERAETDLEKYVLTRGHISTTEARVILLQVLEGLRVIHGLEIVHRDLKPANILRIGERWVLADFGISKDRMSHGGGTFQLRGTSGYAAPEQILTGVEADATADIFAFGKLIVFVLTGGTDIDCILFRDWRGLARRCTAEEPRQRPSLDAVAAEIESVRE